MYIYGEAAREKSPAGLSIFATKSGKTKALMMMHEKDTEAHLSAAEPKLQQAVFGRDREIASPTSDTCLTSKTQKQK